jgi:Ca-activated chloride channel family protein
MKIKAQLTHDKVRHDQENDIHGVVTLKAPKMDWQNKRAPVCIIPVVDISGSMTGDKLLYAKQSVLKLIDHLKPGDWCGLVAFEDRVYPIFEPREMTQTQKEALKAKVGALQTKGCTNFSGGMLQALKWAKGLDLPQEVQIRTIMFTDGHANAGVATDLEGLSKLLVAKRGHSTLSAFGYGEEADQDLLAELAKQGGGNYAFVRNPEDALTAFARELGGLLSTYATNIEVKITPCNGHKITEVLSDVDVKENGKEVSIQIPNIYSEEEVHLVVALKLSEQSKALPRKMNVAEVVVSYKSLSEDGELEAHTVKDKTKVKFVKAGSEQKDPTPEVNKLVGLAELVQAQIKAEEQAKQGNYAGAVFAMNVAADNLVHRGLDLHADVARGLGGKMATFHQFQANQGYLQCSKGLGTRASSVSMADQEASKEYATLGVVLSNEAQDNLVEDFTSGDSVDFTGGQNSVSNQLVVPSSSSSNSNPQPEPPKGVTKSRSSRW